MGPDRVSLKDLLHSDHVSVVARCWHCCSSCDWQEAAERSFVPSKAKRRGPRAAGGHQWLEPSDCQVECAVTLGIVPAKLTKVFLTNTGQSCHSPQLIRKPADPAAWLPAEVTLRSSARKASTNPKLITLKTCTEMSAFIRNCGRSTQNWLTARSRSVKETKCHCCCLTWQTSL